MNLVFIIKNRDNTPFMVVSTTPEGSTFKPMTEDAKELAVMLRQEYGKTPVTKPELIQTMDSSKIIEGPSPSGSGIEKKVASLTSLKTEIVETKNLPVLSISEVLLSEFSNSEFRNVLTFKASSFISDQTQSSFNFEIKGVRAIWDPSLSIPGTNRRGGFRCPVGTRYGGQITDRFGRSCGWGVARRIANQIADIGERLEQRDDDKRKRRLDRRNARMMRRLGGVPETGRVEGGLRGIADRLDGGDAPQPQRVRGRGRPRAADVWNASNIGRVINAEFGGRRREGDEQTEVDAPSTRVPQNRRRDVIPETAPTSKPKPRPARRPAPAGQRRPQARPRVVPQTEDVDVLTAREASDANASEDFKPYVLRKYDEYAKRVRELRAGGANAGMLTRREWYAINKPNLRDAWKDAHGRSAPQDFEPPTPQARRPRNNRGRRKKATTAGAARSATRKPTPDDVPEPAPAKPVKPAARRVLADRTKLKAAREAVVNANREIDGDPNHVFSDKFDKQVKAILREPKAVDPDRIADLIARVENIEDELRGQHRMIRGLGQRVAAGDLAKLRKLSEQQRKLRQVAVANANRARRPEANPKAPARQAIEKIPDFGGAGWDAVNARNGSTSWKKGNWEITLIPKENGKFRGFYASNSATGQIVEQRYEGPQGQRALNDYLGDFENILNQMGGDPETPSSPSSPTPSTPPAPTDGRNAPRGMWGENVKPLNKAKDRHEKRLPKMANGELFKEVEVGNKGIQTEAEALAYKGPLNDIPDRFLDAVLRKRSDFILDPFGDIERRSALAKAMFPNGPVTDADYAKLESLMGRIKRSRTKVSPLTDDDKKVLKKLKDSGVDYISYYAGTGGANPSFHLFIGDDGSIDGRGYLRKPADRQFGNGANHAELLGAALAEKMGFAHGHGRIMKEDDGGGGVSIAIILELGPNFADGVAADVGDFNGGARAITDKESRLAAGLLNAIMGAHDRHPGNGMVFRGNGALPIDFGRGFYQQPDTPEEMKNYLLNGEYRGLDSDVMSGYKDQFRSLVDGGMSVSTAKAQVARELKKTLEQWHYDMQAVLKPLGAADYLAQRFEDADDIGNARVSIAQRKRVVENRVNIMKTDAFINLMLEGIR